MTEYKKEAPCNTRGCMTHSSPSKREPNIEWHLAEIINLVAKIREDALLNIDYHCDYYEEFEELIDRVRKAWDLVPDDNEMNSNQIEEYMKKSAEEHANSVYERTPGFPAEKEWTSLKAHYAFIAGFKCASKLKEHKCRSESQTGKADATLQGDK